MSNLITIEKLKDQFREKGGSVGQILCAGINRYVVVEETPTGVRVMGLYGTFLGSGAADEVIDVIGEEKAYIEDRNKWKGSFQGRWNAIAAKYPAINTVQ